MSSLLRYRLRGGVLPLVLGISLVIAVLCSSLILVVEYYQIAFKRMDIDLELARNAESGIQYLMASEEGSTRKINLFDKDSALVSKEVWGVYDVLASTAFRGSHTSSKVVMCANLVDSVHESTLYLVDSPSPLYLAGDAHLAGTVYLPRSGVKPGYANGSEYKGDKLIDGDAVRRSSNSQLPAVKVVLRSEFSRIDTFPDSVFAHVQILENLSDSISHTFQAGEVLYYKSLGSIELAGFVKGKIVIVSEKKITVTPDAKLEDIIICAPEIVIQEGFSGRLQAIAFKSILLEDNVQLQFPSALVVSARVKDASITISKGSRVTGDILLDVQKEENYARVFSVNPGAVFEGFAHINGSVELLGTLHGHLSCRNFSVSLGGESKGNYILDADIDYDAKLHGLTASGLWRGQRPIVIQWLY